MLSQTERLNKILDSSKIEIPIERIRDRIAPPDSKGCWNWIWKRGVGYPHIGFDGNAYPAHRLMLLMIYGDLGKFHVLHKCDNKSCVNPDHLYLGNAADNSRDRWERNEKKGETETSSCDGLRSEIGRSRDFRANNHGVNWRYIHNCRTLSIPPCILLMPVENN